MRSITPGGPPPGVFLCGRGHATAVRSDRDAIASRSRCFGISTQGHRAMDQATQMTLTFRCPAGLESVLPRPIPAVAGLPDWFKTMPVKSFNPTMGGDTQTVKKCPPFIDAMTFGFLIPLAIDLEVRDGEFSWNFEVPKGFVSEYSHSPIGFHDSSQIAGTPFVDDDRFIIK